MGSSQHSGPRGSSATSSSLPIGGDHYAGAADIDDYMPKPNADGFILPVRQRVAPYRQSSFFLRQSSVIDLTMDSDNDNQDNDEQNRSRERPVVELDDLDEKEQGQDTKYMYKTAKQQQQDGGQRRVLYDDIGGRDLLLLRDDGDDVGGRDLMLLRDDDGGGRDLKLLRDDDDGGRDLMLLRDDDEVGGRQLEILRDGDEDAVMREVDDSEENEEEEDQLLGDLSSIDPGTDNEYMDAVDMMMDSGGERDVDIEGENMVISARRSPMLLRRIKQEDDEEEEVDELLSLSSTPEPSNVLDDDRLESVQQSREEVSASPRLLLGQKLKGRTQQVRSPTTALPPRRSRSPPLTQNHESGSLNQNGTQAPAPLDTDKQAGTNDVCGTPLPKSTEKPAAAVFISKSRATGSEDGSEDSFLEFEASTELSDIDPAVLGSPMDTTATSYRDHGFSVPSMAAGGSAATTTITQSRMPSLSSPSSPLESKLLHSVLKTGYVYDVSMYFHQQLGKLFDRDDPHPESPHRIYVIYKELKREGYLDYCERINSRRATKEEVLRVHSVNHYNMMRSLQTMDEQALATLTDEFDSLYLNSESFYSGLLSAGSVIEGCVAVVQKRVKNAFAIVRPPGHHAEQDEPMGFCLFNNVAISIQYLRVHFPEIKRILVLDWDIHFGNGTQRLTNDDRDVLYVSLHRYEARDEAGEVVYFYPEDEFGSADYCGSGTGIGRTVNIPWTCDGVHDGDYLYAFHQVVMPVALEFEPSLVIVSAGFDAAEGDHIGQCCVTPAGYSQMTHMLKSLAGGKLVLALEGGYNLKAIAKSSAACMSVLMGEPPVMPGISQPSDACIRTIEAVKRIQAAHWNCFK